MNALVVGGGPAGISAVAWLNRFGGAPRWVSAGELGGMLRDVHNPIVDYPGIEHGPGTQVAEALADWTSTHLETPDLIEVTEVTASGSGFQVDFDDGTSDWYRTVILATGTRKRRLDVPGEEEGLERCVFQSTSRHAAQFEGQRVAVVGGGDAAVEGANNLADAGADEVLLITRSRLKARSGFVDQMESKPVIRRWPNHVEVAGIIPEDDRCTVELTDGSTIDVAALFVRIGVEPVTPTAFPNPRRDSHDFVVVDRSQRTSVAGLLAAGDVTSTPLRSIATSVGDGGRAARTAARLLELL